MQVDLRLNAIVDPEHSGGHELADLARLCAQGGATLVQLRDKLSETRAMVTRARAIKMALEPFNVLVNYWWHDPLGDAARADSAFDALLHAILSIRGLPSETRRAWGAFFGHYVFGAHSESIDHIPRERHGMLGGLSPEQISALRAHLKKKLGG